MPTPKEMVQTIRDQEWDREKKIELIQLLMKEVGESTDGVSVEETTNRELTELQQRLESEIKYNEELIQEIQNLKRLKKRERVHAEETKDEPIEKLGKQLEKAERDLNNLRKENEWLEAKKLRLEEDNKNLEAEIDKKNKKAEELKDRIKELEHQLKKVTNELPEKTRKLREMYDEKIGMLKKDLEDVSKASHKECRESLQQAGEICEMNCVMSCLVCVCQLKMQDVHLCYDHLARIIMHGETDKKYLQCGAYLSLLVKKELATKKLKIEYSSDYDDARDKDIDKIWEILRTTTDAEIMILGRIMEGELRHTLVCDVQDREEEDKLAFYDLQRREWGRGTKEDLKYYLKEDKGINLYTLNLDFLKTLIEKKRDAKEKCCTSGINDKWIDTAVDIFRHNREGPTIPPDLS